MATNFPSAPVPGQSYAAITGQIFIWNGYAWLPQPVVNARQQPGVLLQVVNGVIGGSGLLGSQEQMAEARVSVKSQTSQLIVLSGYIAALTDVVDVPGQVNASLVIRINGGAALVTGLTTNDTNYHSYKSIVVGGSHLHGVTKGSLVHVGAWSNSSFPSSGDQYQHPWLVVHEVEN